jgi:hypothetical protein
MLKSHSSNPWFLITLWALLFACSSQSADRASGSGSSESPAPSTVEPSEQPGAPADLNPAAPASEAPTTPVEAADPAAVVENAPPPPEVTAAVLTMEERVTPLVNSVAEARLLFVACEQAPCSLRTQTTTLTALHQVLSVLSREFDGRIAFSTREQLDAYLGRSFQADVSLDVSEGATAIPADPNDLLGMH